jgi:DNA-binding beta-propeller fold protein YncE
MHYERWQRLFLMVALVGTLGIIPAYAGPLAVVANFRSPGILDSGPPWPAGTVSVIDTATDQLVGPSLTVGVNPQAVAITPNGKTAVVACSQSSEVYFISLPTAGDPAGTLPKITGKLVVGSGFGDTFYPGGLSISPDGEYVAVTSFVGAPPNVSTQISKILVVHIYDPTANGPVVVQTLDLNDAESGFTAEAVSINSKGTILVAGPSAKPPVIFALSFADGSISFPEPDDDNTQMGTQANATGYNFGLSPDNHFAVVTMGDATRGAIALLRIDDSGKMTVARDVVNSGGVGAHSAVFSPDGATVYIRNIMPSGANIAVFHFDAAAANLTDTGQRLMCPGVPQAVVAYAGYTQGAVLAPGINTLAVTPDGKKVYAANPYGGTPLASYLFLYGAGNVLVFNAGTAAPAKTLTPGINPIAVAIQPVAP